jgi:uncharacterized protein (DUF433 family)
MSTAVEPIFEQSADVCGGLLRLAGTRVTVLQIVVLYRQGETPEEIAANFPQASLAGIYAALAYYHAHRDDIEADLSCEATRAAAIEAAVQHGV